MILLHMCIPHTHTFLHIHTYIHTHTKHFSTVTLLVSSSEMHLVTSCLAGSSVGILAVICDCGYIVISCTFRVMRLHYQMITG